MCWDRPVQLVPIVCEAGSEPYHEEPGGGLGFPGWPSLLSNLWTKLVHLGPEVPPFLELKGLSWLKGIMVVFIFLACL